MALRPSYGLTALVTYVPCSGLRLAAVMAQDDPFSTLLLVLLRRRRSQAGPITESRAGYVVNKVLSGHYG